jgi:hypothetical protein
VTNAVRDIEKVSEGDRKLGKEITPIKNIVSK